MTTQAVFLFENVALATRGATVAASSVAPIDTSVVEENQYRFEHLANDGPYAWRSGALSEGISVRLVWDLGTSRPIDTVVLAHSNLRRCTVKVRLRRAVGATPKASLELGSPMTRGDLEDYTFDRFPWVLGPGGESEAQLQADRRLHAAFRFPAVSAGIRIVEVELIPDETLNSGAEFFEVTTPIIGQSFSPAPNVRLGWALEAFDEGEVGDVPGGGSFGTAHARRRALSFDYPWLDRDEAFDDVGRIAQYASRRSAVWAWMEPEHPALYYRQAIVGRIEEYPRAEMTRLETPGATRWRIKETLV